MGLCPFHPDHNLGSFVVTPGKNIWRCFAEGIGGGPVKFIMMYDELSYLDAAFKLAKEYAVISQEEYERYSRKKWDETVVTTIRKKIEEPEKKEHRKADQEVTAAVYAAMSHVCPLSKQHEQALIRERHLDKNKLGDFFTFPTRRTNLSSKIIKQIGESLSQKAYQKPLAKCSTEEMTILNNRMKPVFEQIQYVPGFYKNKATGEIDFSSYRGLGFLVRDEKGVPRGIQIRRDTCKEGESRYVWFSSAFAEGNDAYEGGASSGAPGGVIIPDVSADKLSKACVCITEGRFKAEKIAAAGNIAIYVSGVSSWQAIMPQVDRVIGTRKRVFLMFDSDFMGNTAVYKQLSAMEEALSKKHLECWVVLWSKTHGKGFDDLVINLGQRYSKYLSYMKFDDVMRTYESTLQQVFEEFGAKSIRDITSDKASAFTLALQDTMENN